MVGTIKRKEGEGRGWEGRWNKGKEDERRKELMRRRERGKLTENR